MMKLAQAVPYHFCDLAITVVRAIMSMMTNFAQAFPHNFCDFAITFVRRSRTTFVILRISYFRKSVYNFDYLIN